jgi:hypothetical protein
MMKRLLGRAAVAGALAIVGIGLAGAGTAHAVYPFTVAWACEGGQHLAYNPVTGQSMGVGNSGPLNPLASPVGQWVCVETGGTGGGSVGVGTYAQGGQFTGVVQYAALCVGTEFTPGCTTVYGGYTVGYADAGAVGAKPCVVTVAATPCASVGVTPNPSSGVTYSVTEPNAAGLAVCGVNVAGQCAVKSATVQSGGTAGTAYVGTTPVDVTVPAACVAVNRENLTLVSVSRGSGC